MLHDHRPSPNRLDAASEVHFRNTRARKLERVEIQPLKP